jgi:hypothetical protein
MTIITTGFTALTGQTPAVTTYLAGPLVRCVVSSLAVRFGTLVHASSRLGIALWGSETVDGMDTFAVDPGRAGAAGEDHFVGR